MWFPQDGEGRRPKGEVKNSLRVGNAPSLDDRLDVSNCATDITSPEEVLGGFILMEHTRTFNLPKNIVAQYGRTI